MRDVDGRAIAQALADNVLATRFEDLDRGTIDNTKARILDMVGCALGGGGLPEMAAVVDLARSWGGTGDATILGYGVKAPAHEAAMINCLMGRSFDWGPLTLIIDGKRSPTHTSETTVLTALAMGETKRIDGRELIAALVVGDDLAARLWFPTNRAQPGQEGSRRAGFEPWGTVTTFAAAAIAGRVLGLSGTQMRHALGICVNMVAGAGSGLWDGATTFKLSQGTSARSGITAARLAQAGWTGIDDPLFGERGSYYANFANGCDHPDWLTKDLGTRFHVEAVFKPYPGGRPTHAPADAALALVRKHDLKAEDIERAILRTSPPATAAHYSKPYKVGEYPTGDALFNYRYSVATALVRGRVTNENFTEESIRDPRVQTLIAKMELAELSRERGVELEVQLKSGSNLVEYVPVALGEPANPLSRDQLVAKFMTQVDFSRLIARAEAEKLVALLDRLEDVDDVTRIVELAVKRDRTS